MTRSQIRLGECGLLTRANARRYCGDLNDERFDREVGPHVTPRMLGSERFYARKELDAWIDLPVTDVQPTRRDWLKAVEDHVDSGRADHRSRDGTRSLKPHELPEAALTDAQLLEKFGLMSESHLAILLGITVESLRHRSHDQLPAFFKSGRRRLFKEEAVREYMDLKSSTPGR